MLNQDILGYLKELLSFCMNGFLLGSLWVWLFQSNAVIEMQPKKGVGSKAMCVPDIVCSHPTRPLVLAATVEGFCEGKRFPASAIFLIHPLCSTNKVEGAGHHYMK